MRHAIMLAMLPLLSVISQTGWTQSASMTGTQLKDACTITIQLLEKRYIPNSPEKATQAVIDSTTCNTYISAMNDTIMFSSQLAAALPGNPHAGQMPYCIPDNVNNEAEIRVILKYIDDTPAAKVTAAPSVIYDAFRREYPCK